MGNKAAITGPQVFGWLMMHLKLAPGFMILFSVVGILVWDLWAEEKVEEKIKAEVVPIQKQVSSNTKDLKIIKFRTKQILLILEKSVDKKIIKQVKEDTEKFRTN